LWFAAGDPGSALAVITALEGDVHIIRQKDTVEIAAHQFDHLFNGDSIVTGDGRTTVFFQSGTFRVIESHQALLLTLLDAETEIAGRAGLRLDMAIFNRFFHPVDRTDISHLAELPTECDTLEFTIHTPGNTAVRTNRPDMLWGSVPGANWYAVSVKHKGEIVEDIATTDTFVPYPEHHDSLASGSYVMRVCAYHNNDSLCCQKRIFRVLSEDEIKAIDERVEDVQEMSPDAFTARLLTAVVYEKYDLMTDAIDAYQDLIQQHRFPIIFRTLAVLHARRGDLERARHYFNTYRSLVGQP
jgi:hypothetical protein